MKLKQWAILGFLTLAAASAEAQSPVWKVSGRGTWLYLGGSVHILREEDYPLPEAFEAAFAGSSILVLETDVDRMQEGGTALVLLEGMFLPEPETLQSVLRKDLYKRLKTLCGELSLPIESLAKLKPGMVVNILTILSIEQSGFIQQGVDTYFLNRAREEGRERRFLEPLEFQIDLLVNMGAGYEDEYNRYALEDFKGSARDLSAIVDEWRRGGGGRVESNLADMAARFPSVYEAMILRRNDAWLPQIEGFLADDAVELVIAGLAHFYGPDGLLTRLERLGYRVEQLD
jgi:uncharacterized protein YbaP (TraB family)